MKQFLMNAYNGRALTSVTSLPWVILATLALVSCEGSMSPDATIVMDASTQVDASLPDERLIPGVWEGEMTGVMNSHAFTATISLSISEQLELTGSWAGQGQFIGEWWRGPIHGEIDDNGCFSCPEIPNQSAPALCVSTKFVRVLGIFVGCLDAETSTGTWDMKAFPATGWPDLGYDGNGVWVLQRISTP